MNEYQSRLRRLLNQLTAWWASTGKNSLSRRPQGTEGLRREATARAQQARAALNDLRTSDAGRKAADTLHDLRDSEAGKRAASAISDLRTSETGKRAASALQDLRGRESVRKVEESARRALQDLRHGTDDGASGS
jgi:hypothetical protein